MAVILLCGLTNARAMEGEAMQEAVLQRMASMAEAATRAAIAAEEALKRATSSSSGGTNPHEGLSAASRILKTPDTFNGEDIMLFQQWKHQFTSWLCFGDSWYAEALDLLEKTDTAPAWSSYNEDERLMSQKLYAVLTSSLRGKCAHVVRAESKVKDGFKLWFNKATKFSIGPGIGILSFIQEGPFIAGIHLELWAVGFGVWAGQPRSWWQLHRQSAVSPGWESRFNYPSQTQQAMWISGRRSFLMKGPPGHGPQTTSSSMWPSPTLQGQQMAQVPWKSIELKVGEKERIKERTRAVAQELNGPACCMVVDEDVAVQIKAKVRAKQKGSQRASRVATKVGPRVARKAQVVVRWHMNSAQTAWSTGTGAGNAPTWQSIRYPTNKRWYHLIKPLLSRHPWPRQTHQLLLERFFNLELQHLHAHLLRLLLHPQLCLKGVWCYSMMLSLNGCNFQVWMKTKNGSFRTVVLTWAFFQRSIMQMLIQVWH